MAEKNKDARAHDVTRAASGLAVFVIWATAAVVLGPGSRPLIHSLGIAASAWLAQSLVSSRAVAAGSASSPRTTVGSRIWLGAAVAPMGAIVAARLMDTGVTFVELASGAALSAAALACAQELLVARRATLPQRRAVVVGTGSEAVEIIALIRDHPEMSLHLVGCVGDEATAERFGLAEKWLGPSEGLIATMEANAIEVPIVAAGSFRAPAFQEILRQLLRHGYDVSLSWGISRIAAGRVSTSSFGHETMPFIRAARTSRPGMNAAKRATDIALSSVGLILASPVLLATAVAVRLESPGPAFFRQRRVGWRGEEFEMVKFRTMVENAEDDLPSLNLDNQRTGPLFKMNNDPRVTRLGRMLRKSSIDELPQLFNVLRGEMSMVGPRPALPREVANFDEQLNARASVRPGITGLWQVEARSNKSFAAYRRLDLHYVENWSLMLDVRIILATAQLLTIGALTAPLAKRLWGSAVATTDIPLHAPASRIEIDLRDKPTIAVLGAGYVGLTSAVCLQHLGFDVVCADVNESRVAELQVGISPILEVGLDKLLAEGNASGRLTFTDDPSGSVAEADFVFLCVPTPQGSDGAADLSYLDAAAAQIGPHLRPGAVVINKSTVPVGSTERVASHLGRTDVSVISNPEFLREGTAIHDWLHPDRIVVGGERDAAQRVMDLYEKLPGERIVCDAPSAELMKYAANAYLATRLTFVNSIAEICDRVGANVGEVTRGMGLDKRIGPRYLQPGPGWGGSCLPKDTHALAYQADTAGMEFTQLRATIAANERHYDRTAALVLDRLQNTEASTVSVFGMAFKAGTGDTRESPSIKVMQRLVDAGVKVKAYDPAVAVSPVTGVTVYENAYDCADGSHALILLTEWEEFAELNYERVASLMAGNLLVDVRNLLDFEVLDQLGFVCVGPGRSPSARELA